ncbi:MAG: potassium transporter TrkG [Candidatus Micrarchaeia archaeon]
MLKNKKIKNVAVRFAEIIELFSYFNIVPALFPLLVFGIQDLNFSMYFIIQGFAMLIFARLIKQFFGPIEEDIPFSHNLIAIVLAWIMIPFFCAYVYFQTGLGVLDSYFESVSAWTTTGFSIYPNLSELPKQVIFWRSFEQWLGGLGIVAFVFFLFEQKTNPFLFTKTEGRIDFIKPTMKGTLKTILKIYFLLTFIGLSLLSFSGMDFYNALNISMTAIPTGGFIPTQQLETTHLQNMIIILLVVFGATPFFIHYNLYRGRFSPIFKYTPLHLMVLFIVLVSFLGISSNIDPMDAIFHSASAMTNAGFSISKLDSSLGSYFYALIVLMLIGGCLGSTAGAVKIDRVFIVIKGIKLKIEKMLSPPDAIVIERFMNHSIKDEHIANASLIILIHLAVFLSAALILNFYADDLSSSLFEVASAMGNVGLSDGIVGAGLPGAYKSLFIFLMIAGRIEFLTFLVFIASIFKR